ncbi:GNAT family N-acetyltransferase [Rhizosphaericola mali]|uniref:GNAT family N-acetyltransferase n=1 Tax=Rhizosphaericola mali TaxID=2545455 RepID=A0A5P2G597_9BACT|nr:GNAT family N-acetyltransferase [Rhizosphaericola mali]QES89858.1 GNAT family N-acetyltransferase [Rhizosphaericola mali]
METITYLPKYKNDFIRLNRFWIQKYFKLESEDILAFEHIEDILENEGQIFFALKEAVVIGTIALKNKGNSVGELCKFAVDESAQGLGVGHILMEKLITYARSKHYISLFLEGNTKLSSSIHLYEKFGFIALPDFKSAYERVDIVMELHL